MMDDDLKSAFRALRDADRARVPALAPKPGKKSVRAVFVLVPSFAVLASAAVLVLWVAGSRAPASAPSSANAVAAASVAAVQPAPLESEPLGFLLETPAVGSPDFDSDPTGDAP
jgi:hypothetical protein